MAYSLYDFLAQIANQESLNHLEHQKGEKIEYDENASAAGYLTS